MEFLRTIGTRRCQLAAGLVGVIVLWPVTMPAAPGAALQFDGVNGYVQVTNNQNLNPLPFTATAWFRTTNNTAGIQGLVSKYMDGSGNGWFLIVQSGQLIGYFSTAVGDQAIHAASTTLVADGFWHHAALTVNTNGGALYLDGIQVGSGTWTGTPGTPTGTEPLQIGRYYNLPTRFIGTIDEVTLWNRALGIAEVNYLQHRTLNGNEDGLAALWHFDEGAGTTAGDATGHGYTGLLVSNPVWVASSAPLVFHQVAGDALQFDGVNGYVTVTNASDLNSFPFTATAWFRTSNPNNVAQGIVSKYADVSGNGWTLIVQNNHLRGFYYRNNSFSDVAIDATSTAAVADGAWHHAALTVNTNGGTLILDGAVVGQSSWVGAIGGTTSTQPLQIGRYYNYTQRFQGDIDEVTVWNRALAQSEVQSFMNLPRVGNEVGLVACWHLNEGTGTNTADATTNGHVGVLVSNPVWVGSTAFLGDGTSAIHTTLGALQWSRLFAVKTIPTQHGFSAIAPFWLRRLDDFGAPGGTTSVTVNLQGSLQGALAGAVPLVNNTANYGSILSPFLAVVPQAVTGGVVQSPSLEVEPRAGTQLDSVNDHFQLSVTESYSVNSGPTLNQETITLGPAQLLDFDGNLVFGSIVTVFTSLANAPVRGALSGGGVNTVLAVNNNSGYVAASPSHTYGNGTPLNAVLLSNGDAVSQSTENLAGPVPDTDCIQNICYQRTNMVLSSTGAVTDIILQFPVGLSLGFSPTNHLTQSQGTFRGVLLNGSLEPASSSLSGTGQLYVVAETLPYWFGASSGTWQVYSGQLIFTANSTSVFVRQDEDDLLQSATNLVDSTTTNRVSNDGYFRNATMNGAPLIVTGDSNGVARISVQLALQPPELRPHFPYSGRAPGAKIPTDSGLLIISNSLASAGSYLNVGTVPVSYGRDCNFPGCTASQAGPAGLPFTPSSGQLVFTLDGGLLAYGSVPPTNLMWGYANGGNFAQQTSLVSTGAFCMAGTFLRGDQTSLTDSQRSTAILFSGFGDGSNPAYLERPGTGGYNAGFANYSGLNFRAPAQGDSYVGQTSSGWYALDPVAKYYVRAGGVNGIHQAAPNAFPSTLKLYGYSFTFTDFGLSYLDGQNVDSVTTGAVSFPPQPAGFTQEFDQMKFACRGDLDSASVPAGTSAKHLAYWNADFTPRSIDFHPTNDDTCGTSPRFLVLGVETKLPFIPQGLHAALGFKPNGNLVCPLDNVANVDSRFEVPAQLSLQGPTNSVFTISTVAEGYFNNWETPGAAALDTGFYNLAGKIRVPFFTDVKVHLHITPINASAAQVDIMGGWPDPDSAAADLGWSVNGSNYFNAVEFDLDSDGWPVASVPQISNYRNSSTTQYHPRAQRNWLDVATFDYPLTFDSVFRSFKGFQDAKVELPILDVNSRLKELAPGKVDFDFAQDLTVQLPRIKVLDFVNDALDGNIGPLLSVSNAIRSVLNQALDVTGINNLSKALREDAQDFFNPILDATIDPVVAQLYPQLTASPQTNVPAFLQQVYADITSPSGPLAAGMGALNNVSNQASSVVLTLDQALTDVLNTAGLLDRVIAKDPNTGNRQVITTIIEQIVKDQAPSLGFVSSLVGSSGDAILNPLLADIDPTLTEIQGDVEDVSNQLAQVQMQLNAGSGGFNQALGSILQDANGMQQFLQSAGQNVTNYLASVITPAGDLFTANPAAAQQAIRQQIGAAFLASVLTANYQKTFRDFLGDDNFALDQAMNALFDQINSTIRNALLDQIQGAQDGIFRNLKGAGLLGGTLLSAKIKGAPTFDGDSLRDIHLNAAVQMNIPDKMNFNAYMDIKELNSLSVPVDCIPAGSPSVEITLGAKDVPLSWAGQGGQSLTLSVEARWTQQSGAVIGIGGSLDIGGSPSFEGCSLQDLGASLAIGQTENYFAAKVAATVPILGIPVDMQAGLFAGHACSLDPLRYIDPNVSQVLLNNPAAFSGVYAQFGGGFSLSDLLGISAGCVLDADATVSSAYYWQGGASLGVIGGRQAMGVKLSLLCVLSGELDYAAFLALNTSGAITVGGSAQACGSIGPCPFCISGCKSVTIQGTVSTHGVDYSVDY